QAGKKPQPYAGVKDLGDVILDMNCILIFFFVFLLCFLSRFLLHFLLRFLSILYSLFVQVQAGKKQQPYAGRCHSGHEPRQKTLCNIYYHCDSSSFLLVFSLRRLFCFRFPFLLDSSLYVFLHSCLSLLSCLFYSCSSSCSSSFLSHSLRSFVRLRPGA